MIVLRFVAVAIRRTAEKFGGVPAAASIHAVIQRITEELEIGMGKIGQPLRVAVTGSSFSPPIDQTLELLGRERSLARIERALTYLSTMSQ